MANATFSLIKQMLDADGKPQLFKGSLVIDETSGKTFEEFVAEAPGKISTVVDAAVTALKGGVGADYDSLKKLGDVLAGTKASVDTFLSQGPDATPETVDTLKELLAGITANKTTIDNLLSGKLDKANLVNNLTTGGADKVLSAEQGKIIKGLIDDLHIFANAIVLDSISRNAATGNLTFNGKELNGETGLAFVTNTDAAASYNGKIRLVISPYTKPASA